MKFNPTMLLHKNQLHHLMFTAPKAKQFTCFCKFTFSFRYFEIFMPEDDYFQMTEDITSFSIVCIDLDIHEFS